MVLSKINKLARQYHIIYIYTIYKDNIWFLTVFFTFNNTSKQYIYIVFIEKDTNLYYTICYIVVIIEKNKYNFF